VQELYRRLILNPGLRTRIQPITNSRALAHLHGPLMHMRKVLLISLVLLLFTGSVTYLCISLSPASSTPQGSMHREAYDDLKYRVLQAGSAESSRWAPISMMDCKSWMPRHYAPCVRTAAKRVDVEFAEELVYADFELKEPGFDNISDRHDWRGKFKPVRVGSYPCVCLCVCVCECVCVSVRWCTA